MTEYLLLIKPQKPHFESYAQRQSAGWRAGYFLGAFQSAAVTPSLVMKALT